jgi:hypothetical protein
LICLNRPVVDFAQSCTSEKEYDFPMISFEDCIGLCGLTEAEIAAIAEHVPEIAAAVLGQYLLHQQHGPERIRQMLVDDIRAAVGVSNAKHAADLASALRHLLTAYPEAGLPARRHEISYGEELPT